MPDWRSLIEHLLPWFDSVKERQRNAVSKRIERRSEAARLRAERVISEYRSAEDAASRAGDRLVDEARR